MGCIYGGVSEIVVSPTGTGKTTGFGMQMIRLLPTLDRLVVSQGGFTFCTRENLPSEEGAYTTTYGFFVALFDTKYHGLVDTLVVMDKYHETHPEVS